MKISLGSAVLFDTGDQPRASISSFGGGGTQWLVDTVQRIRAGEVKQYDRGNAATDLSFTVQHIHADAAAAAQYLLTQPIAVAAQRGELIKIEWGAGDDLVTYWLKAGQLTGITDPKFGGCSTWITYTMTGGLWTDVEADATASMT